MLGQLVPWQRFTYKLLKCYKGKARMGRRTAKRWRLGAEADGVHGLAASL